MPSLWTGLKGQPFMTSLIVRPKVVSRNITICGKGRRDGRNIKNENVGQDLQGVYSKCASHDALGVNNLLGVSL